MSNRGFTQLALATIILAGIIICNNPNVAAQEASPPLEKQSQKGWGTLSGKLCWVKIDSVADREWKELGLIDNKGNVIILIGEAAIRLLDKIDKVVTVTGVYKSPMQVQGKATAVMEVRFIDYLQK